MNRANTTNVDCVDYAKATAKHLRNQVAQKCSESRKYKAVFEEKKAKMDKLLQEGCK
jgi:hypothetical protein